MDRISASVRPNEKHGSEAVAAHYLLLNSRTGVIKLNAKQSQLDTELNPFGMQVDRQLIHSIEHSAVIFVENLTVMAHLAKLNLPDNLNGALFVYRGDAQSGQGTKASQQFSQFCRGKSIPTIAFTDCDPQGFIIAAGYRCDQMLVPKLSEAEIAIKTLRGQSDAYLKQFSRIDQLAKQPPSPIVIDYLTLFRAHRQILSQELMIRVELPLTLEPLTVT